LYNKHINLVFANHLHSLARASCFPPTDLNTIGPLYHGRHDKECTLLLGCIFFSTRVPANSSFGLQYLTEGRGAGSFTGAQLARKGVPQELHAVSVKNSPCRGHKPAITVKCAAAR
jgi:hypothetical protein